METLIIRSSGEPHQRPIKSVFFPGLAPANA